MTTTNDPYGFFSIGQPVLDLPSQRTARIVEITHTDGNSHYRLSDNVPLDPTHDGAFGDRWRTKAEIIDTRAPISTEARAVLDFTY